MSLSIPALHLQLHTSVHLTDFQPPEGARVLAVALENIRLVPLVMGRPLDDLKERASALPQAGTSLPKGAQPAKAAAAPQATASFPKELQPLVPIVRAALPALAGEFPFWLLWAYAVKQRLEIYHPSYVVKESLSIKSSHQGDTLSFILRMKTYLDPSDLGCGPELFHRLKNSSQISKVALVVLQKISGLIVILHKLHPKEKNPAFLELIQLLQQAHLALICNAFLEVTQECTEKENTTQLTVLAEFAKYIHDDNSFKLQFPLSWKEQSASEKAKAYNSFRYIAKMTSAAFEEAFAQTVFSEALGGKRVNAIDVAFAEDPRVAAFGVTRRNALQLTTVCQIQACQKRHFWTPERRVNEAGSSHARTFRCFFFQKIDRPSSYLKWLTSKT